MVTLADARRVIAAAEQKAGEIGQPMNIAVADAGGNLVAHVRMDGAWMGSVDIAIKKAWSQLAAVRTNQLAERDGDVLREIVSSSIELFFESRDGEGQRAPQCSRADAGPPSRVLGQTTHRRRQSPGPEHQTEHQCLDIDRFRRISREWPRTTRARRKPISAEATPTALLASVTYTAWPRW